MADAPPRLCTEVLESGLHTGQAFPHCIDEDRCKSTARCFWRKFHQLADEQYRKKQAAAQQELFT
jgi:hypothetical protein